MKLETALKITFKKLCKEVNATKIHPGSEQLWIDEWSEKCATCYVSRAFISHLLKRAGFSGAIYFA